MFFRFLDFSLERVFKKKKKIAPISGDRNQPFTVKIITRKYSVCVCGAKVHRHRQRFIQRPTV